MRERRGDALEAWMTEAAASGIAALARFAQQHHGGLLRNEAVYQYLRQWI